MKATLNNALSQMRKYPSAVVGSVIILFLIFMAIYAMIAIPYGEAIRLWRGADNVWVQTPRNARPAWLNYFRKQKQPVTMTLTTADDPNLKSVVDLGGGVATSDFVFEFDYQYDGFPSELGVFLKATFASARPNVAMKWITPDGREIQLGELSVR
ncbi:MAG TPA: ABC transporter permease, partial [Firmicutes bacterium]|nr:ABC transporter permease [Bacillota bacterium]